MKQNLIDTASAALLVRGLDFSYGPTRALRGIDLDVLPQTIMSFIGPSGCGKSTFLRCFNRMNDLLPDARVTAGTIHLGGTEIHAPEVDPVELRRRVGMVFQKSNPFPGSIYQNIAYGPRLAGIKNKTELDGRVETSLRSAALWDEVKDRLRDSAMGLSGGQQQRLCIARAIAVRPEVLLMDEPCSALDPIATARVEELIVSLKEQFTIVIVTHNMQQAARISDRTAFFYLGELIEEGETKVLFSTPTRSETEDYICGRFG